MLSLTRINAYVTAVCQQIRWKKARFRVAEEMSAHLLDGRDAYMAQGLDEEAATEKAIAETGDAVVIGSQFDRTHRPKPQWDMLAVVAALLLLGLLVRMFIFNDEDRVGLLFTRLASTAIGVAGLTAAYFSDFTMIGKYPKTVYFGVMSIAFAMFLYSQPLNGRVAVAQTFYGLYAVLLFPLAFAAIIFAAKNRGYVGIVLCELAVALPAFLALRISSVSGFLHLAPVGAALLIIAVGKDWFGTKRTGGFLLLIVPAALLSVVFAFNMSSYYWRGRLAAAFQPSLDPNGMGFVGVMTRALLGGAKLFGRGHIPGEYYAGLTEPNLYFHTDLLLTALISLFGWIALVLIAAVLLFFIVKGFRRCCRQRSALGFFVSVSMMMMFCMQVIYYVAFNLGFQLAVPISLPFISYGNAATVINLVLTGFMLSVFRTGHAVPERESARKKDRRISI